MVDYWSVPNFGQSFDSAFLLPHHEGPTQFQVEPALQRQPPPQDVSTLVPWLLALSVVGQSSESRLRTVYQWRQLDFEFPSALEREQAVARGDFVQANTLPLGLDAFQDRIFLSMPRWKDGIPATLATVPRDPRKAGTTAPLLRPYPSWEWHRGGGGCEGLTSVYRMAVDACGRLWVLDSGVVNALTSMRQQCPPQLLVFDLRTDELLWRYQLPQDQVKQDSLFTNVAVDVREGRCDDAHAYLTDVWGFAIVVYSWRLDRSWRVSHPFFYPDPLAARYDLHGLVFRWTDGVFGLSLSPVDPRSGDRTLFFHPMTSFREFSVPTSVLRNETAAGGSDEAFRLLEEPRGFRSSHASASSMDRNGVMFYNLVTQDAVGCWNSRQPYGYRMALQGIVARDNETLVFPNDLKVDHERRQNLWVLSNKLPVFLYSNLDPNQINFRVMTAPTDVAVSGTVCDPNYPAHPLTNPIPDSQLVCPAN